MTERPDTVPSSYRNAVWVSRCVGRAESSPLRPRDVEGLAQLLEVRRLAPVDPLHLPREKPEGCIVKDGRLSSRPPDRPGTW